MNGMGKEEAKVPLAYLFSVYPRWKTTPALNAEWLDLLSGYSRPVVDKVLKEHVRLQAGGPSLPKVAKALRAFVQTDYGPGVPTRWEPKNQGPTYWPNEWAAHVLDTDPDWVSARQPGTQQAIRKAAELWRSKGAQGTPMGLIGYAVHADKATRPKMSEGVA